ncbi:ankyrin repeat domain-containing protein [Undibacterium sp. MH2W]|uniref:ankyrin repeat domain-containing protein n=1 Tax=Undibacterium sp. MH2W TaxID=3413044 RepID=UPI003BF18214
MTIHSWCVCKVRLLGRMLASLFFILMQMVFVGSTSAQSSVDDDLIFAVKFNDAPSVSHLIEQGANARITEPLRGETLLMIAIREGSMRVVDVLLAARDVHLEARAKNGDTALMIASFLGKSAVVKKLVAAGAEVNQPGWAAVHYAAASGDVETLRFLLDNAAYIDSESPNKTTPLMLAIRSGKYDTAQYLLESGADIHLKNDAGMTALDFAMESERKDLISLLNERLTMGEK